MIWRGVKHLVEIKNPDALRGATTARKLTAREIRLHDLCNRYGSPITVVETEDDVLRLLGARRSA